MKQEYKDLMHNLNISGCLNNETAYNEEACSKIIENGFPNHIAQNTIKFAILKGVSISSYSLSILLNITLILLLCKDPLKCFRNSSSFLILNLAISDLIGASISLFHTAYSPKDQTTIKIMLWLVTATLQCSFVTVMLVSFDRFMAIAFPFRYRMMNRPKRTIVINNAIWLFSLGLTAPLHFVHFFSTNVAPTKVFAVNIIILIGIIVVFYTLTHWSFRRQRKQLFAMNSTNNQLCQQKLRTEKKFGNTMLLVSCSLILFTSPYVIMFSMEANCISCLLNTDFQEFLLHWRYFFALYYAINPIIYAWRLTSYQKSLKQLLNTSICAKILRSRNWNRSGQT